MKFLNIKYQALGTSPHFAQIGLEKNKLAPALLGQATASYASEKYGTFSINYIKRNGRYQDNFGLTTLSYSRNLFKNVFFILNAAEDIYHHTDTQLYMTLVWSFANPYTVTSGAIYQNHTLVPSLSFNKALPVGNGYGYNVNVEQNRQQLNSLAASYYLQTDTGTYGTSYSRFNNSHYYEVDAAGSVVFFEKNVYLARFIDESFAVVQIPNVNNVDVYNSHQLIGQTNQQGNLFIPNLLAYQQNLITIDPVDIPLNHEIEQFESVAIPYLHSGVLVDFPVRKIRNIALTLVDINNQPLMVGASIEIKDHPQPLIVGYEGNVFIVDSSNNSVLTGKASFMDRVCYFKLLIPLDPSHDLLDLGKINCHEKKSDTLTAI